MPRNGPGALRALRTPVTRVRAMPPPPRIPGLSTRTTLAIHRAEHDSTGSYHLSPGATQRALRRYREFLATPGRRTLYPRTAVCPACPGCGLDDVREARDVLEETVRHLPPSARAELSRTLRRLDHRYRLRTLPDPRADQTAPWWHRRLGEGAEGW
ncbi:hypothetical protein [Streptomyces aurantiogriseus]|uniref:Uncharacterized protein n=1 Tax=Streptomyces aurantiogriseus TaxID=66870 RepID=A0A918CDT2_9ACTN|nr:hypothetical protein [Streptomyces aurantiogriseus]GGR18547.1 hypothetical protein GCM10010251_38310 [Streptomyces aurantiogriseus]